MDAITETDELGCVFMIVFMQDATGVTVEAEGDVSDDQVREAIITSLRELADELEDEYGNPEHGATH